MKAWLLTINILLFANHVQPPGRARQQAKIDVSAFEYKLHDLDGCGEIYYANRTERDKQGRYIMLADYVTAVMMINHHLVRMQAVSGHDKALSTYKNREYKVIIKVNRQKAADYEYYITTASMTLWFHGRMMFTKKVYGGGGC